MKEFFGLFKKKLFIITFEHAMYAKNKESQVKKAYLNYLMPSRVNVLVATDFAGPFKETAR